VQDEQGGGEGEDRNNTHCHETAPTLILPTPPEGTQPTELGKVRRQLRETEAPRALAFVQEAAFGGRPAGGGRRASAQARACLRAAARQPRQDLPKSKPGVRR
jgi:hypothetical protein